MNENVKITCVCELGCDKGAIKKTIENNVFTVYGNVTKNNCIIIKYHGELIDKIDYTNYENNLYISYYFDNNPETTHTIPLAKCIKCIGENYCSIIDLGEHNNISFKFNLTKNNIIEKSEPTDFKLEIKKDLLTDILQKHGLEENTNLPIIQNSCGLQIKKIINSIRALLFSFIRKSDAI